MFKIGEFSRFTRVSVKTLRHYDEVGLLRPRVVDHFTNYRYYSADQVPRLNQILALRELGFSLEQIGRLLAAGLSPDQLRGMFQGKRLEIVARSHAQEEQLGRVDAYLAQLESEQAARYGQLSQTLAALLQWIELNQFAIAGPTREVFLRFGANQQGYVLPETYVTAQVEEFVTELQVPIVKR